MIQWLYYLIGAFKSENFSIPYAGLNLGWLNREVSLIDSGVQSSEGLSRNVFFIFYLIRGFKSSGFSIGIRGFEFRVVKSGGFSI